MPVGNVVTGGGMPMVLDYYESLGQEYTDALADMLVFDAVIANTDRHFGNLGFLVDARTNQIEAPAPLFDHGNSLFNFAGKAEMLSRQAFLDFADVQRPACYSDFFAMAKELMSRRHKEMLRHLLGFRFRKHARYNLAPKRLKYMEAAVHVRASVLLGS